MTLRVVFMGTPAFAVASFEAIVRAGHHVEAVYTRAPSRSGRGLQRRPSPVHEAAVRAGIADIRTPTSLRSPEEGARFAALAADLAVVVAYGLILPRPILAGPRLGCLNLHASLLPRWRGAAPIHRAVMAGDAETGVAVMRMEEGLDTGPVAAEARVAIGPDATTGEIHDALASRGAALAVEALADLERDRLVFTPQADAGVTYAAKITNEEARIDWSAGARRVHDHVRGLSPWPGAVFEADLGRGIEPVRLLRSERAGGSGAPGTLLDDGRVACGADAIRPLLVQRPGKGPVPAAEFWRGARLPPGTVLG